MEACKRRLKFASVTVRDAEGTVSRHPATYYHWIPKRVLVFLAAVWIVSVEVRSQSAPQPPDSQDGAELFFENAFEEALVGDRPESLVPRHHPASHEQAAVVAGSVEEDVATGPDWSRWVSAATVEREVKAAHERLIGALRSPSHFAVQGHQQAADAFSILANLFIVVDEYHGDVRWKRQAPAARHRFADAAAHTEPTSFALAQLALEDLQLLLAAGDFNQRQPSIDVHGDEVDRQRVMRRLELAADQRLPSWLAVEQEFQQHQAEIVHESEIVAMLTLLLMRNEMPDADDDDYRASAETLLKAAAQLRTEVEQNEFSAASRSLAAVRRSCEQCHDSYR